MRNVNELGYGFCPTCKKWKLLERYHPKDKAKKRKEKDKYCTSCIEKVKLVREPFRRIKKSVANHKTSNGESNYVKKDLMALLVQQGGKCAYCSTTVPYGFSLDHVIPTKFGGKNELENILLTCAVCNSAKQHFELFYWLRRKGYKLNERIFKKVRIAYERHDYECIGDCKDCHGASRAVKHYCETCSHSSGASGERRAAG